MPHISVVSQGDGQYYTHYSPVIAFYKEDDAIAFVKAKGEQKHNEDFDIYIIELTEYSESL